jgi:hypothetical protein
MNLQESQTRGGTMDNPSLAHPAFVARSREFQNILLNRAEAVLHDHALIEDYLLQP